MYLNPYSEATFFQFFSIFWQRLLHLFPGQIASDEIQIIVISCIASAAALIGSFLVLQKMTMLANALSHTSLMGIAIVYLIFPMFQNTTFILFAALISGVLTTFLTDFFSKVIKLQEDASIGLVFTTLFALGILLVTIFAKDTHIGTELVMGNADALRVEDIKLSLVLFLTNFLFIIFFFKELKIITFDPFLSTVMGISPGIFKWLLMILTAMTTMCAFRAVGVLMVLAFITGPFLVCRLLTYRLSTILIGSCLLSISAVMIGVALSRHILSTYGIPLSTGGLIVCVLVFLYVSAFLYKERRKIGYPITQ